MRPDQIQRPTDTSGAGGRLADPFESRQLSSILALIDQVLSDQVLGVYLHGSSVLGGLLPTSDLDVLVVSGRRLSEVDCRSLVDGLLKVSVHPSHRAPGRPVELSVVAIGDIKPWRYPPRQEFLYGEWLRDTYEQGAIPQPEDAPDLCVLLTMVLQGDTALMGAPPAQLLDPVPEGDLIRGATAGIPQLLDDLESDTRNVLLTLARIWTTVATGQIRSKDAAAEWALERIPASRRAVLTRARDLYLHGEDDESWTDLGAVHEHAEYVVDAIRHSQPSFNP